ncbi:DNA repair protein endonuclease SAE2/CtIP C-terminus-domain-containing protein [Epithele typhae]|uniref:DNA repair protein endonuclease SAE2/CtIP C-terminus-domain-containing protein n=1 Tax=Epithele typhae TaxID=378194 RepID=UPI0020082E5E|nr:DNA repair protein endonuclease SAE2/CtIP C-terminus-domain-containing protein [Epithele typhae]KAH9929070.1 DNA repair protein endonuclease SAE2/CtIP C-terminus-domain-containing protein [Epithele typhae]
MRKTAHKDASGNESARLLETKMNNLRWANNDLNKQVFAAIQRGHRLAGKLGYRDLEEAEAALATQLPEAQQSQLEELSQLPSDELAEHVQALQAELLSHVQLSKATLEALGDALKALMDLRAENERLVQTLDAERRERRASRSEDEVNFGPSTTSTENPASLAYARAELAALQDKYACLLRAKEAAEKKHAEDYKRWKEFKQWLFDEKMKILERPSKRRKFSHGEDDEGDGKTNAGPSRSKVRSPRSAKILKGVGNVKRKLALDGVPLSDIDSLPPASIPPAPWPTVLTSRDLNTVPSNTAIMLASPEIRTVIMVPPLEASESVESICDNPVLGSSQTEPDLEPVSFLYPSLQEIARRSLTIPRKRSRLDAFDQEPSDTELESQAPSFLLPSQIVPITPAQMADATPRPDAPPLPAAQLMTPETLPRLQGPGRRVSKAPGQAALVISSPSSSSDPPSTPTSRRSKKAKERAVENDENAATSPESHPGPSGSKNRPADYSAYKGRGRYAALNKADKETINAKFEIDPARNNGVGYQFDEVVRDKERRRQMHGHDCECCRDYYAALKPPPPRLQAPMWRSPSSSPVKPVAEASTHKQTVSRHRATWARAKTPPGYWNIGFPDTQEVAALNAEANRMHAEKRAAVADEAE